MMMLYNVFLTETTGTGVKKMKILAKLDKFITLMFLYNPITKQIATLFPLTCIRKYYVFENLKLAQESQWGKQRADWDTEFQWWE